MALADATAADVDLVLAWLDGTGGKAGVAMTGADLEGILESIDTASGLLPDIDASASRESGLAGADRSKWRIKAERIRRAVHWARPLQGG